MTNFICPKHGPVPDEEVAHETHTQMPFHEMPTCVPGTTVCGADLRISELDDKTREAMRKVGIAR